MNTKDIWKSALATIELKIDTPANFNTWFSNTSLIDLKDGEATVGCKNGFVANWLENHFYELIRDTLRVSGKMEIKRINFVTKEETEDKKGKGREVHNEPAPLFQHQEDLAQEKQRFDQKLINAGLNTRYTLENFIVGSSNRLAHAAAMAIVDNPGTIYNPYYIYGGVGLGKTHLMQSIGIEIIRNKADAQVYYCSCESFLNELVNAIRSGKTNEFRSKYRELDVLIIDDIQFISNKVETQTELFHTFNVLHQANKQIILASDRPPTEIQNLEDRLRSRFQGGMVADINQPDYEMRVAILQKKAEEKKFAVTQNTIETIARLVESNIRELEGSLIKVFAFAGINGGELTEQEIAKILGRDAQTKRAKVKPGLIIEKVCEEFEINMRDIRGKRRTANIALARQSAMYLLRTELDLPLTKVAKHLNRNDHTTVIHAVNKLEELLEEDAEVHERIKKIKSSFQI